MFSGWLDAALPSGHGHTGKLDAESHREVDVRRHWEDWQNWRFALSNPRTGVSIG